MSGGFTLEQRILDWLETKHKKQVSVTELISDWEMSNREKKEFLGSMKYFQTIKLAYVYRDNQVHSYLVVE